MKKRKFLFLFLLLNYTLLSYAEYFKNLNLDKGLSQFSVMTICQDELGRMWFGTREGINVYDGYHIQYYKGWINNNPDTLWLGNAIEYICQGTDNNIYFLADKNLFQYDIRQERFSQLTRGNKTKVLTSSVHNMWYIENDSVFKWQCDTKTADYVLKAPSKDITALTVTRNGELYIGTKNGIFITDTITSGNMRHILENKEIYSIFESENQGIWIGTLMHGLFRIVQGELVKVPYSATDGEGINDKQIREFAEDNQHNIWFGTFSGLQKFDSRTGKYSKIQIPQYIGGLRHSSIFALYKDKQGIIWTGSYYGGASYFNPNKEEYLHYDYQAYSRHDHYYSYIGEMAKDKHGNLWISTDGGGISCLDKNWDLCEQFTADGKNTLPHNNIKSIAYDEKNDYLFIATYLGGLSKYDIQKRTFHNYLYEKRNGSQEPGNIVYHIKIWNDEVYLTSRKGLFKLNIKTDKLTFLSEKGSFCEYFDIDSQGNLYIMGWNHVEILSLTSKDQRNYISLNQWGCKGNLSRILATDEGVYICTLGSGIYFYDRTTQKITHYTHNNSPIPSDYCYDIKQVDSENFVISSDKGISLFSPTKKKISTINLSQETSVIYGGGIFVSPEQDIYIGSTKGVTLLKKEAFQNNSEKDFPIYFSKLRINNQLITPQSKDHILRQALPFTKKINLKHNQNNCIIEFSFSDYKHQSHQRIFEYMLEGFNSEWVQTSANEIHYTNLEAGTYTLFVRPLNGNKNQTISLEIQIDSPWYFTWWAWLLYIIVIGTCVAYFIHNRWTKHALALSLEREHFEKQHIEEMNQAKLVFFTNVSHEFKTPLTLIISHIESLLQEQLPVQLYNKVLKIKHNAQYMTNLVTELLDFRRFTQNQVTLRISEQNICLFLKEIYLSFSDYAQQRNINYTFQTEQEEIRCWADWKQMEKVFFNLLSNAFKYTEDGGSIGIHITARERHVVIQAKDNGIGISEKEIPFIFNRFFQSENQGNSSQIPGFGIGLALTKSIVEAHHGTISVNSEYRQGSTFTVTLALDKEVFKNDTHIQFVENTTETVLNKTSLITDEKTDIVTIPKPDENFLLHKTDDKETGDKKKYTLLLVEDNQELRQTLEQIFEPFYHVITAANGKEGLSSAIQHKPDIIISDIMMPEMNGTDMCLQIKNNIDLCHIPVILLTALNGDQQNIEGLNRGADDYISKPFNSQILLARTNNLVRNRLLIQHQLKKEPKTEADLTSINPLDQKLLKKVAEIIDRHIDDIEFDIPKLCAEVGMGRSLLYSKFKALTGMTPNQFLLNYRLKYAATLLQKYPTLPIAEISDRSGFNSPLYFSRCFKNQYGETPQTYRRKQQEEQKQ